MRVTLLATLFALAPAAAGRDQKEPPKMRDETNLPRLPETKDGIPVWAEKVTVRRYLKDGEFQNPHRDVDAVLCKTKKGEYVWWLSTATGGGGTVGGPPKERSEVEDRYGQVWVVGKTVNGPAVACYAKKK